MKLMQTFINFRVYSDYSLGYGVNKIDDLVEFASKQTPALALTDRYNLFAALEFSMACLKKGMQPIIGGVIKIDVRHRQNKHLQELLLIAKDEQGYKNLMKLVSISYIECNDGDNYINISQLKEYSEGLVLLYGSLNCYSNWLIQNNCGELVEAEVLSMLDIFKSNMYLEIARNNLPEEANLEYELLLLAQKHNIPIIGTSEVCFLTEDMYKAQDALICIANGRYILEDDRPRANSFSYFKTERQIRDLFEDLPEAVENTINLAKRCSFFPKEATEMMLPSFPDIKKGYDIDQELTEYAKLGLAQRLKNLSYDIDVSVYEERLRYELEMIIKTKYSGYFLIVSDFIKWSKANSIPVGPGRGSGVASIVAWALEITDLDPLRYGLVFERFLNPERVSMPDFDIDFCQIKRNEVLKYVVEKYGRDRVAQIVTFGKLQARAVLRDVARVLQIPYGQADKICKMVPNNPTNPITLQEAITLDKELQQLQKEDEKIEELIEISLMLEGVNRHVSTHAAGIVISDKPLNEIIPLYKDSNTSMPAVQYNMKYVEKAGLVKFDFLGLKTLSVIAECVKLVKKFKDKDFLIENISLEDSKTYQSLSEGETIGVFQFEGAGMTEAIKKLKPDRIEDLIALGSLYRPGPMDNIPQFINRKHGIEKNTYLHEKLEPILRETYGIIVYQEQVIQIAQVMANFTLGSADLLRRAMGKKIKSEMEALENTFIEGAIANGIDRHCAIEIFELVNKFASYGFNKAHAAAYALLSYQTAYLKAHYPLEFLVASINIDIDDTDKINLFIQEAKNMSIEIIPPNINLSDEYFGIHDEKILYGLAAIKNVGVKAITDITEIRKEQGEFKNIEDFIKKCAKNLHKRSLEFLIKAGAFDMLEPNRNALYSNIDILLKNAQYFARNDSIKQVSLFEEDNAIDSFNLNSCEEWCLEEKLQHEFDAIGFYLSEHPLSAYSVQLEALEVTYSSEIIKFANNMGRKTLMAGVITAKRIRSSKRGKYAFLQISDQYGLFHASVFDDRLLYQFDEELKAGNIIIFEADLRIDETGVRIMVTKILDFKQTIEKIKLSYMVKIYSDIAFEKFKPFIGDNGYSFNLVVVKNQGEAKITIPNQYKLNPADIPEIKKIEALEIQSFYGYNNNAIA